MAPKLRHINFRRRGITQKKTKYSEQGKVRHKEDLYSFTINSTLSYTVINNVLLLSSET